MVKVHWVPGHMSVAGNEKVAEAAKQGKERPGIRWCTEQFASLTCVRLSVAERKRKKSKHWSRSSLDRQDSLQEVKYELVLETQCPNEEVMDTETQVSHKYFLLKLGHAVGGFY